MVTSAAVRSRACDARLRRSQQRAARAPVRAVSRSAQLRIAFCDALGDDRLARLRACRCRRSRDRCSTRSAPSVASAAAKPRRLLLVALRALLGRVAATAAHSRRRRAAVRPTISLSTCSIVSSAPMPSARDSSAIAASTPPACVDPALHHVALADRLADHLLEGPVGARPRCAVASARPSGAVRVARRLRAARRG